jgi:D-alanine-D-alanine ligase
VEFIHDSVGTHAIAERYIDGRELYVGVIGNERLQVFPVWEMHFKKMVEGDNWPIATERVKWSTKYQEKHGIATDKAQALPEGFEQAVGKMAKRVYRALELTGTRVSICEWTATASRTCSRPIPTPRSRTARTSRSRRSTAG